MRIDGPEQDLVGVETLPSEYFHRQIWLSFVDDPLGVKMVGRSFGSAINPAPVSLRPSRVR